MAQTFYFDRKDSKYPQKRERDAISAARSSQTFNLNTL
jgi:hypothetical protein